MCVCVCLGLGYTETRTTNEYNCYHFNWAKSSYLYFGSAAGLACSDYHDNYAEGIVAAGRTHIASRQLVKRDETAGAILTFAYIRHESVDLYLHSLVSLQDQIHNSYREKLLFYRCSYCHDATTPTSLHHVRIPISRTTLRKCQHSRVD